MRLNNIYKNKYNQIEGTAFFPYFNKEIDVICENGVSPEYAEKYLEYLEQVNETLILKICRYAEFFLKDMLENTSVGEIGEENPFKYENLLDLLQYFSFETLHIEALPESAEDFSEINVLNLSGGCDWQEDEGLQCLVKNGEVIYFGAYNAYSVWRDNYLQDYIGNYVLYEKRDELRKKAAESVKEKADWKDNWNIQRFVRWRDKGLLQCHKLEYFADKVLAAKENVDNKEATRILENSYLYQLMNEYPKLLDESIDFWYECYCIEKEKDAGGLVMYISENCEWDMF